MDRNQPRSGTGEILERLRPVLEWVFTGYGIPPEQAEKIVEESSRKRRAWS